jgi:hypothetical protein
MTPLEYVRDLFTASKPHWEAGKQMHTAFSSAFTLLIAALAAFGIGSGLDSLRAIAETLTLMVAFWFGLTLIFIAPYRLLDAARKEIQELKDRLADKSNKKRIALLLSTQMVKGRDFMAQLTNPETRGELQNPHVDAWSVDTESLLRKELGPVYFALYVTPDGGAPIELLDDKGKNITWNGLRFRVNNLRNMILEFSRP